MSALQEGYARFRETYWATHQERYTTLAKQGQAPSAMVISCADSRVSPEIIFDCAPGEIFVVRNVANLVPPFVPGADEDGISAALLFATTELKVSTIVVLGHSLCGGIRALVTSQNADGSDPITHWMSIAQTARAHVLEGPEAPADLPSLRSACEHESVRVSVVNLHTFPWIKERVDAGALKLQGMYFNISTGELETVD